MKKRTTMFVSVFLAVFVFAGSAVSSAWASGNAGQGNGNGGSRGFQFYAQSSPGAALPAAVPGELSQAEIDGLMYMREEEKLAHDVYASLHQTWNLPLFTNINASEEAHFSAVGLLIERYGLTDPANTQSGVFINPDLQALYNDSVIRGQGSISAALKVGAAIEEIDIRDLQTQLAQTDNADIQEVYQNLEQGSVNHLNAFIRTLKIQTGEDYSPQYLSLEAYNEIFSSSTGWTGNGQGNRGGQGGYKGGGRP
jgi:hypothetical protein